MECGIERGVVSESKPSDCESGVICYDTGLKQVMEVSAAIVPSRARGIASIRKSRAGDLREDHFMSLTWSSSIMLSAPTALSQSPNEVNECNVVVTAMLLQSYPLTWMAAVTGRP